jgi:hypothetical protein
MNITIDSEFNEIEAAIHAVKYPQFRPAPSMRAYGSFPTPANYRAHADAMEAYDVEMEAYEASLSAYKAERTRLENIWKEKLRAENSNLNEETFNICYSKAYEDGHSDGYCQIRSYMEDIADLALQIIKANSK